jgi:hypothetical protein
MNVEQEQVIRSLLSKKLNWLVDSIEDITTGHSGFVYKVAVNTSSGQRFVAVKLTPPEDEMTIGQELIDYRVHATRLTNFLPAYRMFTKQKLATYKLLGHGAPERDAPYFYLIMSFLYGESIKDTLAHGNPSDSEKLQYLSGEALAKLHLITSSYDGWVAQEKPYSTPWMKAFFMSLESRLAKLVLINNDFIYSCIPQIYQFVEKQRNEWEEPQEFVFSQLDGLQAMAQYINGSWEFTGYIDIEDHKFADPRFVLAGFEYALNFEDREISESFWQGYQKIKKLDPTYVKTRTLFQLYYALAYFPVVFTREWRGKPQDKEATVKKFERIIKKLIS